jgi:hypothetical protein
MDLPGVVGVYPVSFSFSGPVTGFSEQIFNCDQNNNCQYMWQGNIPSGVISIYATLQYANYTTRTLTFTGTFTGGYFSGAYTDVCFENEGGPCFSEWQGVNFFSGTWSNGWKSTGGSFWEEMDSEPNWIGLIGMPISTPEPTSIALLGSGVLGLIGYWRKRLRM